MRTQKRDTNAEMLSSFNPKITGIVSLVFAFISAFAFPFLNWASMFMAGMGLFVAITQKMGWKLVVFNIIGLIAGFVALLVAQK